MVILQNNISQTLYLILFQSNTKPAKWNFRGRSIFHKRAACSAILEIDPKTMQNKGVES